MITHSRQKLFTLAMLSLLTSHSFAASDSILLTQGAYDSNQSKNKGPLLAVSKNEGIEWSYPAIKLSPEFRDGNLFTSDCNQRFCVTLGEQFSSDYSIIKPLVMVGKDGIWSENFPKMAEENGANFSKATCNSDVCIFVGGVITPGVVPLIGILDGASWSYPESIKTQLPQDFRDGRLDGVECQNDFCVAVGHYTAITNGDSYLPLIATSADRGKSWSYSPKIDLPDFISNNAVVSCSQDVCAIGARYGMSEQIPVILTTVNHGLSWSVNKITPSDMDIKKINNIHDIKCHGTTCIAVGHYATATKNNLPLLALSSNSGKSWSYPSTILSNLPLQAKNAGVFSAVSCNSKICIAVGESVLAADNMVPLMAISHDLGATWTYQDIYHFHSNVKMNTVSCSEKTCFVSGSFFAAGEDESDQKPFIISSHDNGATWKESSNLPSDLERGSFFTDPLDIARAQKKY
jgi:hypothetical protein